MSFGEHLEELRGALFRSVVGLVIGFLIGLLIAKHVVRWIETPLKNGLRSHYAALSMEKLKAGEFGDSVPEHWDLLTNQQLIPQQITIDAESLRRELHRIMPEQFPQTANDELAFPRDTMTSEQATSLLRKWHASALAKTDSFAKRLWQQLPPNQQADLTQRAELNADFEHTRIAVLRSLNWLATRAGPVEAKPFLKSLFKDDAIRQYFVAQLDRSTELSPATRHRLNRELILATFAGQLSLPPPETVELTTWQSVDVDVQALSVHEPFMVYIKTALIVGLLISSPWVFRQLWMFVAVGLYPQERALVYKFMPISLGLFLAGAALAFFFVFEPVLDFLFRFNRMLNINAEPRITDWLSFVLILPLGFGVSFQLPLVMVLLERIGIFTIDNYLANWRIAVLVIFVISMLLTPADPISMLLMAIPLTALYFGGIALCRRLHAEPRSPVGAGYDP
jgi:sec-independent protein translocase protein TatC